MEARLGESLHEELGEHQPGDVRGEADLLKPDPRAVAEVLALLGGRPPAGVAGGTSREVALLVHALRGEAVPARAANDAPVRAAEPLTERSVFETGDRQMNVAELIEHMCKKDPKLLSGIPENQATRLIEGVFRHMNNTLAATEGGLVNYPGFGRFRVRKVEREVDGKKVSRTQILFRRAEAAGGKPADDAETDVC